jgi:hypothetical protein
VQRRQNLLARSTILCEVLHYFSLVLSSRALAIWLNLMKLRLTYIVAVVGFVSLMDYNLNLNNVHEIRELCLGNIIFFFFSLII